MLKAFKVLLIIAILIVLSSVFIFDMQVEEVIEKTGVIIEEVATPQYTGVIIDTRGLEVSTALYPQVFDTQGNLLYGPTVVGPEDSSSLVAYSRSLEKAKAMERAGSNPLLIEASSTVNNTDLILDSQTVEQLLKSNEKNEILDKKAVIFVID
ncbi:hypothetical protein [Fuchsiella alkaliacetigena]|uniref:hypothetical protein n=1 Tax=Fuchsiella alkaliacetigena TaxID=957042 RepID=UPI00200AE7C8|nr:hypothetical protein [Fuchsiella alkaliacetigena]MCK8823574.1 hypothetical protein [Fuchsiella alkaliacetigena]